MNTSRVSSNGSLAPLSIVDASAFDRSVGSALESPPAQTSEGTDIVKNEDHEFRSRDSISTCVIRGTTQMKHCTHHAGKCGNENAKRKKIILQVVYGTWERYKNRPSQLHINKVEVIYAHQRCESPWGKGQEIRSEVEHGECWEVRAHVRIEVGKFSSPQDMRNSCVLSGSLPMLTNSRDAVVFQMWRSLCHRIPLTIGSK